LLEAGGASSPTGDALASVTFLPLDLEDRIQRG
jgi:hypothetical protein